MANGHCARCADYILVVSTPANFVQNVLTTDN
jgi:hypothetical protein